MQTEEKNDNANKAEGAEFGCCGPEIFKKMFEMMSKCCPAQGDSTDFSTMKGAMMKNMMEMFCGPKATDTKEDSESSEKENCCS